jgi:vesicle-associated membrane protein-associated protein A
LDQIAANQNNADKLDKHRFLVQSRIVDDEEFQRIRILPTAEKTDELSRLWDAPRDDKINIKLKVEFKYPENLGSHNSHRASISGSASISENIEAVRNKIISPKNDSTQASAPEVILSELTALRKKYDALVEYTVTLTTERDTIVNQLDTLQRELNKEKSRKKDSTSGSGKSERGEKRVVEKVSSCCGCLF